MGVVGRWRWDRYRCRGSSYVWGWLCFFRCYRFGGRRGGVVQLDGGGEWGGFAFCGMMM